MTCLLIRDFTLYSYERWEQRNWLTLVSSGRPPDYIKDGFGDTERVSQTFGPLQEVFIQANSITVEINARAAKCRLLRGTFFDFRRVNRTLNIFTLDVDKIQQCINSFECIKATSHNGQPDRYYGRSECLKSKKTDTMRQQFVVIIYWKKNKGIVIISLGFSIICV